MITTAQQALGFLAAHAFGHLYEVEADGHGCCTECCGPCAALAWYRDHAEEALEAAVIATMAPGAFRYGWQTPGYAIDWPQAEAIWAKPCPFADDHQMATPDSYAVRRFASTEQPRKCAWDDCPKAASSWGVCDDHLDTDEVREAILHPRSEKE